MWSAASPLPFAAWSSTRQVGLDLVLADVFVQRPRPERALDDEVRLVLEVAGQDARDVVDHRRAMVAQRDVHIARMFDIRPTNGPPRD